MATIYSQNNESADSDDEMYGARQAFVVPSLPDDFDPSIAPTSGIEYLQHVLFEAKKYPPVAIAKRISAAALKSTCDSAYLPTKPGLCPSTLMPTPEWEQNQIENFTKLRNIVHSLRMKRRGADMTVTVLEPNAPVSQWATFTQSHEPLLSVLLRFRQEQLEALLVALQKMLENNQFEPSHGIWVYAVAAFLEHPLSREACGELRDIARMCSIQRRDKDAPNDKTLIMFNLIITLVVHYFGQRDLLDET